MTKRIVLLLIAALFLVACGSDSDSGESGSEADARQVLEDAFSKKIESGTMAIELSGEFDGPEDESASVSFELDGPFASNGEKDLPSVDFDLSGSFELDAEQDQSQSIEAGITILPDNVFVDYGGQTYEVGEELVEQVVGAALKQQKDQPQDLADFGIDGVDLLKDGEVADGEEIDGVATRQVSGSIDPAAIIEAFNKIVENPAVKSQLPPGAEVPTLGRDIAQKLGDAIEGSEVEVSAGEEDGILRRFGLSLEFKVPEELAEKDSELEGGSLELTVTLTDVGERPEITAPEDAEPIEGLLRELGVPPEVLTPGLGLVPES